VRTAEVRTTSAPDGTANATRSSRDEGKPPHRHSAASYSRDGGRKAAAFSVGDQVLVNDHAPGDYRGRAGIVTELGPGTSEFRIEFEDGRQPTTGYLRSGWLDRVSRSS
jgi:hypothetical protein